MLIILVLAAAFLLVLAVFSRQARRDLFKPEHSTWKVLVLLGCYTVADALVGVPLKGYDTLETVGIVAITLAVLLPILLFGEHYSSKWWKVTREKEHDTIPRRW